MDAIHFVLANALYWPTIDLTLFKTTWKYHPELGFSHTLDCYILGQT